MNAFLHRFRHGLSILACFCCLVIFGSTTGYSQQVKPQTRLGMNLEGPADWNTELPFVNVFRLSRTWISQRRGADWGQGPELELDEHGYVKKIEPDCWAETLLCTIKGGHYPSGKYTVLYDGLGEFAFSGSAKIVSQRPGRLVINVDSNQGPIFLRLLKTDSSNYVHNIRVIMPGFEKQAASDPFHPQFLSRWKGVACFRFMDWMHTNGSKVKSWADRPKLEDANFTTDGVALELMIELCNRLDADAWFCMPHLADDNYIRQFAKMVKEQLEPERKVYIEYSNEVWNSIFEQNRYAQRKAREFALGPAERPWEAGGMYYSQRSVEVFQIWEKQFGGTDRLVRVIAWQSGSTWWLDNIILTHKDAYKHTDALGIAPYIGMNIRENGKGLTAATVSTWSVNQVLDYVERNALPKAIKTIRDSKASADKYHLQLVAYEGGQHLVGVAGGENNERMTQLFHQANAHPRMGSIYDKYFSAWEKSGGSLFCYFTSVGRWSKWGSWGIIQYADEDPEKSPKYQAIMRWAKHLGQSVGARQ